MCGLECYRKILERSLRDSLCEKVRPPVRRLGATTASVVLTAGAWLEGFVACRRLNPKTLGCPKCNRCSTDNVRAGEFGHLAPL